MHQQAGDLVVDPAPGGAGAARRRLDANHHVAQERAAVLRVVALEQRERQDVGRARLAAIGAVQLGDGRVVDERDRELRLRVADLAQDAPGSRAEQLSIHRRCAGPAHPVEAHRHRVGSRSGFW